MRLNFNINISVATSYSHCVLHGARPSDAPMLAPSPPMVSVWTGRYVATFLCLILMAIYRYCSWGPT